MALHRHVALGKHLAAACHKGDKQEERSAEMTGEIHEIAAGGPCLCAHDCGREEAVPKAGTGREG
jgi:hypothetical protein